MGFRAYIYGMRPDNRTYRKLGRTVAGGWLAVVLSVFLLGACGSSGYSNPPSNGGGGVSTTAPSSGGGYRTTCTVPQNNGGDHDSDNNGGPDDGDGCDR